MVIITSIKEVNIIENIFKSKYAKNNEIPKKTQNSFMIKVKLISAFLNIFIASELLNINLEFFLIAAPAVVFAGISKGGFGSGVAFVSAAILALVMEPGEALAIMLPLLMLIDLVTLRPYWGAWSFADAKVLIVGGVPE